MAIKFLNTVAVDTDVLYVDAANNRVGIGTTSPGVKLQVEGSVQADQGRFKGWYTSGGGLALETGVSGGNGFVLTYDRDNSAYSSTIIESTGIQFVTHASGKFYFTGGNVGIGTTSPSSKLNVSSASFNDHITLTRSSDELGISVSGGQLMLEGGASPFNDINEDLGRSDKHWREAFVYSLRSGGVLQFKTNGNNERMRISTNGNVGIGTTSPNANAKLHLYNSASATDVALRLTSNADSKTLIGFGDTVDQTAGAIKYDNATSEMSFEVLNSTEAIRINSSGEVGIGTTSPNAKLDVESTTTPLHLNRTGGATALIGLDIAGVNRGLIGATTTAAFVSYSTAAAPLVTVANTGGVQFNTYGAGTLVTDASGNITVSSGGGAGGPYLPLTAGSGEGLTGQLWFTGTTDANRKIFFTNAGTYAKGSMDAASYGFQVSGSEKLTILPSGNVGIGTTSPGANLDVAAVTNAVIRLTSTGDGLGADAALGSLQFYGNDASAPGAGVKSSIVAKTEASLGDDSNLIFSTSDGITNNIERMRITADGKLLIGYTNEVNSSSSVQVDGYIDIDHDRAFRLYDSTFIGGFGNGRWATGNEAYRDDSAVYAVNDLLLMAGGNGTPDLIVAANGNVGIGTTSPSERLHVNGKTYIESQGVDWNETNPGNIRGALHFDPAGSGAAHTGNAITFGASDTSSGANAQAGIYTRSDGTYGTKMYFATSNNYSAGSKTRMMINANGNVGIGTTNPISKFTVTGTDNTNQANIGHSTQSVFIKVNGTNVDYNSSGNVGGSHTFSTGNTERMRITSGGNVGIGTTSPAFPLEISSDTSTSLVYQRTGVSANKWGFHSDNNATFWQNVTSGNLLFTLQNGGNVGIGTTSPSQKLDVNGYARATSGFVGNGGLSLFGDNSSTNRVFITTAGNVGIGTTSPNSKLHVSGGDIELDDGYEVQFNVTGTVTAEEELVLDAGNTDSKIILDGADSAMKFITGNSTAIAIDDSQNVGIGVTNPSQKLHVAGNMRLQNQLYDSTNSLGSNNQVLTKVSAGTQWKDAPVNAQMPNNTAPASAANVGTIRYRSTSNTSFVDVSMQTGATTYTWVNIVSNFW